MSYMYECLPHLSYIYIKRKEYNKTILTDMELSGRLGVGRVSFNYLLERQ
jgi:hypothetical protein